MGHFNTTTTQKSRANEQSLKTYPVAPLFQLIRWIVFEEPVHIDLPLPISNDEEEDARLIEEVKLRYI
eukprot:scaffold2192_cov268-Chaetoceros_neogracile.AAC.99